MVFYTIGLGLSTHKDITVAGLEAVKRSTRVYLEAYTSILLVDKAELEEFYGKEVIVADRDMVETESDTILAGADKEDVSFLVVGDPFGATTHTDLLLRARALRIPTRVIHNASILNAAGASGLQLYNFGQTISVPFFTDSWRPDSFVERIAENSRNGLHTLCLLDIKVKEQSEENMARGRKIYEPPRFMSIPTAISQLLSLPPNPSAYTPRTLAVSLSRVGSEQQVIRSGTLEELSQLAEDDFGPPLHSLVLVGGRLHELEAEYAAAFAVGEGWKSGCEERGIRW